MMKEQPSKEKTEVTRSATSMARSRSSDHAMVAFSSIEASRDQREANLTGSCCR